MPPEIQVLVGRLFQEFCALLSQPAQFLEDGSISLQRFAVIGKCVNQDQLLIDGKQRLMVMRTMQIDKSFSNLFKDPESSLRSIDELPVTARNRKDALQEQLALFTGVNPLLAKHLIHFRAFLELKQRFY